MRLCFCGLLILAGCLVASACRTGGLEPPVLPAVKVRSILLGEVKKRLLWAYPPLRKQPRTSLANRLPIDLIMSSPVLGRNTLYITTMDGKLHALSLDGQALWTFHDRTNPQDLVMSPPVVSFDDTIFFGTHNYLLYQVTRNGQARWKELVAGSIMTPPLLANKTLYLPIASSGLLHVYNQHGKLLWTYDTGGRSEDGPALMTPTQGPGDTLYLSTQNGHLQALSTQQRRPLWKHQVCQRISAPPVLDTSGHLFLSCWYRKSREDSWQGQLVKFHPNRRKVLWSFATQAPNFDKPVLNHDEQTVYLSSDDTYLYAIHAQTGRLQWKFRSGEYIRPPNQPFAKEPIPGTSAYFQAAPCLDQLGRIYVGSINHHLYALSAQGTLLWQADLGDVIVRTPTYRKAPGNQQGILFVPAGRRLFAFHL